jgi:hypothetical protein
MGSVTLPTRLRRAPVPVVARLALAGVVALVAVAAPGCRRTEVTRYGDDAHDEFVANCTAAGDDGQEMDVETFCECAYARFEAEVPFEVVDELPEDVAQWPPEVQQIVLDCGEEAAAAATDAA